MIPHTPKDQKEIAAAYADDLRHSKLSFLLVFYPEEESEPIIERNGEIQAQIALLDTLTAEVNDEDIQIHDENLQLLAAASKKIEAYERRN